MNSAAHPSFSGRYNKAEKCLGAGIRLGGHDVDGYIYGVDNHVSDMIRTRSSVISFRGAPQGCSFALELKLQDGASDDSGMPVKDIVCVDYGEEDICGEPSLEVGSP